MALHVPVSAEDNGSRSPANASPLFVIVALAQGVYYVVTGVWPLVSIGTFQAVTGPKTDLWLVKAVGVLVAIIGAVIGMAGWRRRPSDEIALLAAGSAAGLTAIDVVYVARRRISPIYLLDAVAEVGLIGLWATQRVSRQKRAG